MNKVFKVIWSEARNAYVVVSEIAKNHGSKSCSTKKLLAMLIATGVMTCASFDVLAAKPSAAPTAPSQYVAFHEDGHTEGDEKTIDGHKYIYDAKHKYWVRKGYQLAVEENGDMHTPLSSNRKSSDVVYVGNGDTGSILQSVTSMVSQSGTVTNMGESLNKITASAFAGVSHSGGTEVRGNWDYIIHDPSWKGHVVQGNYKDDYVDLVGSNMPRGFVTADDNNGLFKWDDTKQTYTYNEKPVDYSNVYVIDGKMGVFTNQDGSDFYKGTVFGKNNEILMTVKDDNGHFYSYWASEVTDPSTTMSSYRLVEYKKDLSVLVENDEKLNRSDIKEVTLDTSKANSATICLLRNGNTEAGEPVEGAITVTSGGGTSGSDTFVKISNATANGTAEKTFATGSKVEAIVDNGATTGIKINGQDYTIKSGSKVSVTQNAAEKTTTITVDDKATTIKDTDTTYSAGDGIEISESNAISVSKNLTGMQSIKGAGEGKISFDGANVKVNDVTIEKGGKITGVANGTENTDAVNYGQLKTAKTEVKAGANITSVEKTTGENGQDIYTVNAKDTTYAAGNGITISGENNAIAVNLKAGENNLEVTAAGLALKKDLNVDSVKAGEFYMSNAGIGYGDKAYITSSGLNANGQTITNVKAGEADTDAVNVSQLKNVSAAAKTEVKAGTNITSVEKTTGANGQDIYTVNAKDTTYAAGNGITISGENNAISVKLKAGEGNLVVDQDGLALNKDLQGIESVSNGDAKLELSSHPIFGATAKLTNGKASVELKDSTTIINGKVQVRQDGSIGGVTAGRSDNDAVNVSQLRDVKAEAGKHTTLSDGKNTTVKSTVKDGQTDYKVNVAGDLTDITSVANGAAKLTLGAMNGMVSEFANGQGASVKLFGDTTTINGKVNVYKDGRIAGVADGVNANDAVNVSQLQKAAATSATTVSDGVNTTVTATKAEDGHTDYKVNLNKDLAGDAVNGSQLYATNQEVANNTNRINQLGSRVDRVGAGAAALAALHPLDYDPANKWDFAAGYGNYKGASAVSIGTYYRPNENTMFSVGGSFGGGENMVNAGVSFKFGDGKSTVGISRAAMANKIDSLEADNKTLTDTLAKQNQQIADQGKQLEEQSATIKEMQEQIQQLLKAQASK